MAKEYIYRDYKTNKILLKTVEPNHISQDNVDSKVRKKHGRDPRIDPFITLSIRAITD